MKMNSLVRNAVGGCLVATTAGVAFGQTPLPRLSTVALTGDSAPGTTGLTLASLADPFVNETGTIVFWGQLAGTGVTTSNDGVVYLRENGITSLMAREGTTVALAAGGQSTIAGLPTAALSPNGSVLIPAGLVDSTTGTNTNVGLLQASLGGGARVLIRDATNPAAFDLPGLPQTGSDGESVFSTGFSIRSAYQGLLYTTATPIPGVHGGIASNWVPVAFSPLNMRGDGRAAWATTFGAPTGTLAERALQSIGVVTDVYGGLTLVAATGGAQPTAPWDVVFTKVSSSPVLTDDETVFFVGSYSGSPGGQAVFARQGNTVRRVIEGGQVVDGVAIGRIFEPIRVSPEGDVALTATIAGAPAGSNTGLFVVPSGEQPRMALRRGDAVQGLGADVLIDGFGPLTVSARGLVATVVRLRGSGVTSAGNEALLIQQRSGAFLAGVRAGELFLPPGAPAERTIKRILFAGDHTGYSPYSRRGTLVFGLEFSDYSRGLFVTDVECPADVDENGSVDSDDITAFFEAWEGLDPAADSDGSGAIDSDDVLAFFERFELGC